MSHFCKWYGKTFRYTDTDESHKILCNFVWNEVSAPYKQTISVLEEQLRRAHATIRELNERGNSTCNQYVTSKR